MRGDLIFMLCLTAFCVFCIIHILRSMWGNRSEFKIPEDSITVRLYKKDEAVFFVNKTEDGVEYVDFVGIPKNPVFPPYEYRDLDGAYKIKELLINLYSDLRRSHPMLVREKVDQLAEIFSGETAVERVYNYVLLVKLFCGGAPSHIRYGWERFDSFEKLENEEIELRNPGYKLVMQPYYEESPQPELYLKDAGATVDVREQHNWLMNKMYSKG